jgi:hypothetical protein
VEVIALVRAEEAGPEEEALETDDDDEDEDEERG